VPEPKGAGASRRKEVSVRGYILTGTPGAGKTAVLRLLEARGHRVVAEAATDVIALEQALGRPEPWTGPGFPGRVLDLQLRRERWARQAAGDEAVFFDRSPVCTLALTRWLGLAVAPALTAELARIATGRVYQPEVFFLRQQDRIEPTAARRISYADSLAFERLHERAYRKLGFRLTEIPPGPLGTRVDQVLAEVPGTGR